MLEDGGPADIRDTDNTYDDAVGTATVTVGSREITTTLNARGQVATVLAVDENNVTDAQASYTYTTIGQVDVITHGNGTTVDYNYYTDGRVFTITHDTGEGTPQVLTYLYDDGGRITQISDSGLDSNLYHTLFEYDNRNRLTRERRLIDGQATAIYDISYTYDNGGNRKSKVVQQNGVQTESVAYYYDVDTVDENSNPVDGVEKYGSNNNRLMYYVSSKPRPGGGDPIVETTWYYYNVYGNIDRITTQSSEEVGYKGTRLDYDAMGRVRVVSNDEWVDDWRYMTRSSFNGVVGILAVSDPAEARTWSGAQSYIDTTYSSDDELYGLAQIEDQSDLDWFVEAFRPQDDTEISYWVGGYQESSGNFFNDPNYPCNSNPAYCWEWADPAGDALGWQFSWWPEGVTPLPGGYVYGGWLAGDPDDADSTESGEENHLLLVLNQGGDPTKNGFVDADGSESHPFLIMGAFCNSEFCGDTVYPQDGYERKWGRRFSYLSARQRVSDVELDDGLTPASGGAERTFTDYIGNAPVVDYREPDDDPDELFAYLPGVAEIDLGTTPRTVSYLHTDLLGSTWFKTDTGGTVTSSLVSVRTAFGEIVTLDSGVASRYGYVGAHGYEEHDYDSGDGGTTYRGDGVPDNLLGRSATDGFPFMHTGARYYDPSTGRFLQRDPIGISGGLNVYGYCGNNPVSRIDPNGQDFWDGSNGFHEWIAEHVWMEVHSTETLAEMSDGRAYGEAIGASVGIAVGGWAGYAFGSSVLASRTGYVIVSRWGPPGLVAGNWVMNGRVSWLNYLFSGKWQPGFSNLYASYSSGVNYLVCASSLHWPNLYNPINWIKGSLGQRVFGP